MSSNLFKRLRKRLTLQGAVVSGIIILLIVFAAYSLTWWSILSIEKQELHEKAIHEGEEWVSSKEAPVNDKELADGTMLAYFVEANGKTVIIDQLTSHPAGRAIMNKRDSWPQYNDRHTKMFRAHADNAEHEPHYRYLATVCRVTDGDKLVGYLYMFENMEMYYEAGLKTLCTLGILFLGLFGLAIYGSYYLAGRAITPISSAYEKQKQFAADASHEMRTPLAVMKLAVQGIREDEDSNLSDFSKNTLGMLEQEVERLSRLTENLMALTRSDKSSYSVEAVKINFSKLCQKVVAQIQLIAKEKNIRINSVVDPKIIFYGDEAAMDRLLIILLDNAIKYSPEDSEIDFQLWQGKQEVTISVADQGIGVADKDKEKIFDRFYRVDKARSRSSGGLGLGLSLAKAIVEHHHGKIWVEDNKKQGSIFKVKLPL